MIPPFFLAILLKSPDADVVLKGGLLVRQVTQLHRLDNAIHDQRRAKTGSQAEKEQLATFVISQSLHGGIIHDPDGTFERGFKVETDPSSSHIPRLRHGQIQENRSRVTN